MSTLTVTSALSIMSTIVSPPQSVMAGTDTAFEMNDFSLGSINLQSDVELISARKRVLGKEYPYILASIASIALTYWN